MSLSRPATNETLRIVVKNPTPTQSIAHALPSEIVISKPLLEMVAKLRNLLKAYHTQDKTQWVYHHAINIKNTVTSLFASNTEEDNQFVTSGNLQQFKQNTTNEHLKEFLDSLSILNNEAAMLFWLTEANILNNTIKKLKENKAASLKTKYGLVLQASRTIIYTALANTEACKIQTNAIKEMIKDYDSKISLAEEKKSKKNDSEIGHLTEKEKIGTQIKTQIQEEIAEEIKSELIVSRNICFIKLLERSDYQTVLKISQEDPQIKSLFREYGPLPPAAAFKPSITTNSFLPKTETGINHQIPWVFQKELDLLAHYYLENNKWPSSPTVWDKWKEEKASKIKENEEKEITEILKEISLKKTGQDNNFLMEDKQNSSSNTSTGQIARAIPLTSSASEVPKSASPSAPDSNNTNSVQPTNQTPVSDHRASDPSVKEEPTAGNKRKKPSKA